MNNHSPGPWEIHEDVVEEGDILIGANYDKKHGYPVLIGSVDRPYEHCPFGQKTAMANARLISAAPDLLRAVEAMLEDYEDGKSIPEYTVREMCRAARDKARGK